MKKTHLALNNNHSLLSHKPFICTILFQSVYESTEPIGTMLGVNY